MAFFGLTALGPQNTFAVSSTGFRNIMIFSDDDFTQAWNKVNKGHAPHCLRSNLPEILKALFHGPIPESDKGFLEKGFSDGEFELPDTMSYVAYMRILVKMRAEAEANEQHLQSITNPNCEYVSVSEFHLAIKKNAAMTREVQTKQTLPLTSSQEFGWQKEKLLPPVAGKPGSDITKYAAELIKNGIYY
jgi:hypothetical protein